MKLKDKVAIITGGTKGIGFGCAKIFANYGCKVVMSARGEKAGKRAEKALRGIGFEAYFVCCDVTDEGGMKSLIDGIAEKLGRLDCIVNNAGWHPPAGFGRRHYRRYRPEASATPSASVFLPMV